MTRVVRYSLDEIPFKQKFSHASFEREASTTLWVSISSYLTRGLGESCPRPYVTQETPETVRAFFHDTRVEKFANIGDFEEFLKLLNHERAWIDRNPSAFCALELAWWDHFAKCKDVLVDKIFEGPSIGTKPQNTMVIGLGSYQKMLKTYLRGLALGFRDYKIKISPANQEDVLKFLNHKLFKATTVVRPKIRFDANNSFTRFQELQSILGKASCPIWAIEEPFAVQNRQAQEEFLKYSQSLLILDESLIKLSDLEAYKAFYNRICLNIRISKLGGLLRTQEVITFALNHGIRWGLGCQVGETSLLTRAEDLLLKKNLHRPLFWEGAFSEHLLSEDPFSPKLQLGPWGHISGLSNLQGSGWGLAPKNSYFRKLGVLE